VPRTVPDAPTGVSALALSSSATVSWTAPASDGGSPITSYLVKNVQTGAEVTVGPLLTTTLVTGLTNGTSYTFTVRAVNAAGSSAASAPSAAVTPATLPGIPTGLSALAGNAQATVSWTAPSNGGLALTYVVKVVETGTEVLGIVGTSTVITGLANGTPYTFTVRAVNLLGSSAESAPSAPVTPVATVPKTAPDAPTNVTAVVTGKKDITVSWTPPASNGGSPILVYVVKVVQTGDQYLVPFWDTSIELDKMKKKETYTFTVRAVNLYGFSPHSGVSNSVKIK
jgi:predicted phage tail protein